MITSFFQLFSQVSYDRFVAEQDHVEKSRMAYELYHHYIRFELDSIKVVSIELLLDDATVDGSLAQNMSHRILGSYLIRTGSIEQGLKLLKSAADYFEREHDFLMASEIYNDIGHALTLMFEFDEAKTAYSTSLELGKFSSDPTSKFNGYLGLGKVQLADGDTMSAERSLLEYRVNSLKLNKYEAASDATAVLANLYLKQSKREQGLALMREAVQFSFRSNSRIHHSHAFTNLAIYYFENEQLDSSRYYFNKSLSIRMQLNNKKAIIESLYNLGDYFRYANGEDSARFYFERSYIMAHENGFLLDELDAVAAILESKQIDYEYYLNWKKIKDSLENIVQAKSGYSSSIIEYALSLSNKASISEPMEDSEWPWLQFVSLAVFLFCFVFILLKITS